MVSVVTALVLMVLFGTRGAINIFLGSIVW